MSQKGAKMSTKGPKGRSKVNPKSTKIPQKIATSKKVEKGRSSALSFGVNFDIFLVKNALKIDAKNYAEKHVKKLEN